MDKYEIILFYLDNNKTDFINKIIYACPSIQLEPFFKENESTANTDFAKELKAYFDEKKCWDKLARLKFLYNKNAQNYTTEPGIYNQVAIVNGVKPDNNNGIETNKSEVIEKDFWTGFGDFFGGYTEGDTTTQTTTTTTEKTNGLIIIGAILGLIAVIFIVNKFLA